VVSDLYLFMILIFYPGGYMNLNDLKKLTRHQKMASIRSPMEQNEHCPVCDKHVPDVRFKGTVHELEQVDFSHDAWILADGSVACEDGHGGLMVELCADCIALDKQISVRQITKL